MRLLRILTAGMAALGLQAFSAQAANVHEDAVICFNCTYQQAVEYAKERATPVVECTNNSGVFDPGASQACYSQPRKVVVYDGIRQQGYGFTLSHSNQGGWPMQMTLQVNDRPVAPEILSLLSTAAAARLELQESIRSIPQRLIDSGLYATIASVQTASVSDANCANDPNVRAVRDALNTERLNSLQRAAQNGYLSEREQTVSWFTRSDGVSMFTLETITFGLSGTLFNALGFSASGTFKLASDTTYVTRTYMPNSQHDSVKPGLQPISENAFPTVVDRIEYNNGVAIVNVDINATRVNGASLRFITNTPNGNIQVSKCVRDELKKHFDIRLAPGGGFPQDPLPPTNPPYPGGPGGSTTCTYDVYTRGGYSGSFRADC